MARSPEAESGASEVEGAEEESEVFIEAVLPSLDVHEKNLGFTLPKRSNILVLKDLTSPSCDRSPLQASG